MTRERIALERKKRKYTQAQLAKELGISTVYMRKLENGQANPGRELIFKFENFFGILGKDLFPDLFLWVNTNLLSPVISISALYQQIFPTFVLDCEGKVLLWNPACARMTGINEGDIIGTNHYRQAFYGSYDHVCLAELVLREDGYSNNTYRVCQETYGTKSYYAERWLKTMQGSRYFIICATPIRDENGELIAVVETLVDITDNKLTEDKFGLAGKVFEDSLDGVLVTDRAGRILWVNPAFTTVTGYSQAEVIGLTPKILSSGKHDRLFYESMWKEIHQKGKWQGELWDRRKNGEIYPQWTTIVAIKDDLGTIQSYVAVFSDVSKLKNSADLQFVKQLSFYDSLTGLPNRALFEENLQRAITEAVQNNENVAVLLMDVDRFKAINDTLGHKKGDYLLHDIAQVLKRCISGEQTLARIGGDEFALIYPNCDEQKLTHFANKLIAELYQPFLVSGRELYITACLGISQYPFDGFDGETLLKNAEAAMYRAKQKGRKTIQFYNSEVGQKIQSQLDLENDLKRAIDRHELELYYQPKVDAYSYRVEGFEALIRWNHRKKGMVYPKDFIPMAQESGWILKIDEWVIRSGCEQIKKWKKQGFSDFYISVNVSPLFFQQKDVIEQIVEILEHTSVDPHYLVFEITEDALMQNISTTVGMIQVLQNWGIRISIDDFGTGYSSLSYIKQLPIDSIKIDRSFIRDVNVNEKDQAIVKAIITLAKSLNLKIVAEGVEEEKQATYLAELGCDILQGYLFSKPVPSNTAIHSFRKVLPVQMKDQEVVQ